MLLDRAGEELRADTGRRWLIAAALCGTAMLAGCGQAVISEISDSSLTVQSNQAAESEGVKAEAGRGCSLYDKSPVYISSRCLDGYCINEAHLYACQNTAGLEAPSPANDPPDADSGSELPSEEPFSIDPDGAPVYGDDVE